MEEKKVAIVTGAGRGIGKQIARELANAGYIVAVSDIVEQAAREATEEIGQGSLPYAVDVSCFEQAAGMVDDMAQRFGRLDVLVNNAGISPKRNGRKVPVYEMDIEEWRAVVDVNLNGAFYMVRAVSPYMIRQRYGRIINMSSIAAKSYIDISASHYAATKAGLIGLTKAAAGELGPYGITVNAVAPGRIESDMMAEAGAEANQAILAQIALGTFGTAHDVAAAVSFLASEQARYITGAVINVDGGWVMA
jgi:3-oxoacyl-[acyl-carrier protein] reductase